MILNILNYENECNDCYVMQNKKVQCNKYRKNCVTCNIGKSMTFDNDYGYAQRTISGVLSINLDKPARIVSQTAHDSGR